MFAHDSFSGRGFRNGAPHSHFTALPALVKCEFCAAMIPGDRTFFIRAIRP